MRAKFYQNTILLFGILLVLSTSLSFAYGPAPLNDENVIKQIRKNMENARQKIATEEGPFDEENARDVAIYFKKVWEKAFLESGYDFSITISKMAKEGPNGYSRQFKAMIIEIIMQVTNMSEEGPEFLYEIFNKNDADNLMKIAFNQNTNSGSRNKLANNSYQREEVDSLLRNIWKRMTNSLRKGNIEEALGYFMKSKRSAYKKVFSSSPDKLKDIINTTKNMDLVDFSLSRVKYSINYEAVVDGVKKTFGTYVIFERDEDGSWKINFF